MGGRVGGRERQSATMFSLPGRCTKLVVNSDKKDKWRCWREENGVLFFEMAATRGLRSVNRVKGLPSKKNRKCLTA